MRPFTFRSSFAILLLFTAFIVGISNRTGASTLRDGAKQQAAAVVQDQHEIPESKRIQMAVLLDTSNSMDGLINQARGQIWKIVNEFAIAKGPNGQLPNFEVALFEYGNNSLDAEGGHLRMVTPFTDDLDKVSHDLFSLTTNGGQEYCGHVLKASLERLDWSDAEDDLKLIFIAGNEPYTQGDVDPYEVAQRAIQRSITVNTIFCGAQAQGINTGWQKGARLADGSFINIDQNIASVAVETPHDKKLAELSEKINTTYVFFGEKKDREARRRLQRIQDRAAAGGGRGVAATRATAKAGRLYRTEDFDLVSAIQAGRVKLEDVKPELLPEELKGKSSEEIQNYLNAKSAERAQIQKEIAQLSAEREKFIAAALAAKGEPGAETLESAVLKAVHDQAARKNIQFDKGKQEKTAGGKGR
ncbi:MAG: VWA domain-containing protein [Pirellulales bacterium]|nr:VWA domain-containing protein [Pirellulales bacterium]